MRLQVFLSHSGVCSRRKAFELIKAGKVRVNDKIISEPSFGVNEEKDTVTFNGKEVKFKQNTYIMLNKPTGIITTKKDRFAKKTVFDLLPKEFRHLNPVGRLDKDTSGLLLLTNDGALAYKITHPRFGVTKMYQLSCDKKLSAIDKQTLERGVILEDGQTSPCRIIQDNNWTYIEIGEGKKRQIRRMFAALGYKVIKLKRIKEGDLCLGDLRVGCWRNLSEAEINILIKYNGRQNKD